MAEIVPRYVVMTADQVGSRSRGDRVPEALAALTQLPGTGSAQVARSFSRTAGDEIQALFASSSEAVEAVERFHHLGGWRLGVGIGAVDMPVPDDVRAASGGAFIAARHAVETAGRLAAGVVVRGDGTTPEAGCARVQAVLDLLGLTWRRRRETSWEVARFAEEGVTQQEMAQRLGITASAVSQRIAAGGIDEVLAGKRLAAWLLDEARGA